MKHNLARDFFSAQVLKPAMLEFLEKDGDLEACGKRLFEPIRVQIIETKQMLILSDGFHMVASDFSEEGWRKFKAAVPSSLTFPQLNFTLLNVTQWRFQFAPGKKGLDLNNLSFKLVIEEASLVSTDKFKVGGNPYALMNDFDVNRFLKVFRHHFLIRRAAEMASQPLLSLEEVAAMRQTKAAAPKKKLDKMAVSNNDFENDLDLQKLVLYESVATQKLAKAAKPAKMQSLTHPRNITQAYHSLSLKAQASPKKKAATAPPPASEAKWQTPARSSKKAKLLPSGPPKSPSPQRAKPVSGATPRARLVKGLKNLVSGDTSPVIAQIKKIVDKRKVKKEAAPDKAITQSMVTRFREWKKSAGGKSKQTLSLDITRGSTKFGEIKDTAPAVLVAQPKRGAKAAPKAKVGQKRPPPPAPKKAAAKPTKKTRRS